MKPVSEEHVGLGLIVAATVIALFVEALFWRFDKESSKGKKDEKR